jgi:hypothetical protein
MTSLAQLLLGNSIQLDHGIFLPNLPREGVEAEMALSDWADKMFEAQRVLIDTAQRLQQQKDARHMEVSRGVITRLISYNPQKMNAKPPTIASTVEGSLSGG